MTNTSWTGGRRWQIGVFCLFALLAACSVDDSVDIPPTSGAIPELPTHEYTAEEGVPSGDVFGTLHVEGGCATLSVGPETYLLIWPSGYVLEDQRILNEAGQLVGEDGTETRLGGGEAGGFEVPDDVPDCGETGYWFVVPLG